MAHGVRQPNSRQKMIIIASYFEGETYGLLGPQMAATRIEDLTPFDCIVLAVTHQNDKEDIKAALRDYFGKERPLVGFSSLSGRQDLFDLGRELKEEGALTILAGPQADVDFLGETGWTSHPHRFNGLSEHFSCALQGPAEQAVHLLSNLRGKAWQQTPGLLYKGAGGRILQNARMPWDAAHLKRVRWNNLYRLDSGSLREHPVGTAQVLQHIGCPHASRARRVDVDYPAYFESKQAETVGLEFKGCSFCDVATDKGFHSALDLRTVLSQIHGLPEMQDGRKIPFELINENALPGLPRLLDACATEGIGLSRIHLTLRADWFLLGEKYLRDALQTARRQRLQILLSSVGFESFDDAILKNLNKGVNVATNLQAIGLMRHLKRLFPFQWAYSSREGAVHGYIHPTPWDTRGILNAIERVRLEHDLSADILPPHSVPLIIHHASGLADWIREVERREQVTYRRYVSVIGWWKEALLG